MDFSRRDDGDGCRPCPFSAPGQGDASDPEFQSPPKESPGLDCFNKTRDAFLSSLDGGGSATTNSITEDSCDALAAIGDGGQIFYALYELDKTYCGLQWSKTIGDDPSINSILSDCSSRFAITNLLDPGWPDSTYQCTMCTSTQQIHAETATSSSSPSSTATASPTIEKVGATRSDPSSSTEVSSSTTNPTVASTTSASTTAPSSAINTTATTGDPYLSSSNDQIPTQGIVAIVVCITIAISASVILLFCVLRRRRKQQEAMYAGGMSSSRNSRRFTNEFRSPGGGSGAGGGGDTYEPLISPSHSLTGEHDQRPPLTPPPRLRDRKLLIPSLLRPLSRSDESLALGKAHQHYYQRSDSSSFYSPAHSLSAKNDVPLPLATSSPGARLANAVGGTDSSTFPSSPICAPRANKLEPRPERMQAYQTSTTSSTKFLPPYHSTRLKSPPPVSFTFPPRSSLDNNNICRSPPPPIPAARHQSRHRRGTATTAASGHSHNGSKAFSSSTITSTGSSAALIGKPHPHHSSSSSPVIDPPALLFSSPTPPPSRPRRPHEGPLEIPDLVRPSSPPLIGIARTTATTGIAGPGGSISLQTLAEGHAQRRGRRDSWGSWEEGGGGGVRDGGAEERTIRRCGPVWS